MEDGRQEVGPQLDESNKEVEMVGCTEEAGNYNADIDGVDNEHV